MFPYDHELNRATRRLEKGHSIGVGEGTEGVAIDVRDLIVPPQPTVPVEVCTILWRSHTTLHIMYEHARQYLCIIHIPNVLYMYCSA